MSGETPSLVYLYCIAAPEVAPTLAGLDGLEPGAPPEALPAGDLAAVVSDVPAAEFAEEPLRERLTDLAWAGERALRHERVVETCTLAGPTIPLRFCTLFATRARVAAFVEAHAARLRAILDELAGKAEWELRIHVDRPRFEAWLAQRASEAAARGAREAGGGAGRAYLEAKRAARDARRLGDEILAQEAAGALAAHESAALRAVVQPAAGGGDVAHRSAFLVSLAGREAFEATAARERERLAAIGLDLRLSGPWPPYSFVPPLHEGSGEAEGMA